MNYPASRIMEITTEISLESLVGFVELKSILSARSGSHMSRTEDRRVWIN